MHFDDRLGTVLQHRAAGERAARVQFRQLLDLLADPEAASDPALTRAAYRRLDALANTIPLLERERLATECSARIRDPRLLAWFAAQEPRVALAALARANLTEARWLALIPSLPIRARGLLRHRRSLPRGVRALLDQLGVHDRVLPEPPYAEVEAASAPSSAPPAERPALDLGRYEQDAYVRADAAAPVGSAGDLGELVRRIEAFQKARERREPEPRAHRSPPSPDEGEAEDETPTRALCAFLFTADIEGRIDWAEGAAAPMVVGSLLAAPGALDPAPLAKAIALHRPITGVAHDLVGAEAIAGRWIVDAAPRFEPRTGRYVGTVGRFRRPAPAMADSRAREAADRVRQLLHELRTPVTAIQGFAEVIQQQTVGPVPHEYRALAAGIAGDAARMLAGFAEIERLARLEAGVQELPEGASEFVAIARRQIAQLQTVLSPRVSRIDASIALRSARVPLAVDHAETVAWRFLATLAGATAAGETLIISLTGADGLLRLGVRLPAALAGAEDIFAADVHPSGNGLGTGLLGAGFALRLARAEARASRGDVVRDPENRLVLTLPLAQSERDPAHRPHRAEAPAPADRGAAASPGPLAQAPRPR